MITKDHVILLMSFASSTSGDGCTHPLWPWYMWMRLALPHCQHGIFAYRSCQWRWLTCRSEGTSPPLLNPLYLSSPVKWSKGADFVWFSHHHFCHPLPHISPWRKSLHACKQTVRGNCTRTVIQHVLCRRTMTTVIRNTFNQKVYMNPFTHADTTVVSLCSDGQHLVETFV